MEWYQVAALTLLVVWVVGSVLVQIDEDYGIYWAMGLVYPILLVLSYPIRAWRHYDYYRELYEKNGISRLQYVFGKRVRHVVGRRGHHVWFNDGSEGYLR